MGIVRGKPEGFVDPLFELFGDEVLEALRLVVDFVDVHSKRFCKVEL